MNSVAFDHPDPSIFTVLTVPSTISGEAHIEIAMGLLRHYLLGLYDFMLYPSNNEPLVVADAKAVHVTGTRQISQAV